MSSRSNCNLKVLEWKYWGQKCNRSSVCQNEFVVFPFKGARSLKQTLNDVSNKYESVFFIHWPPTNFHINRGDFLLKIRGGTWTRSGSMRWSMDPGTCFLYMRVPWEAWSTLKSPLFRFVSVSDESARLRSFTAKRTTKHESSPANLALHVKFPKHHRNRNSWTV